MKNTKLKILSVAVCTFIAMHSNGQILDTLPGDPCPPRTADTKVKVYPLPSTGKLKLDMGDCLETNNTILVFDNTGRLVGSYFTPSSVVDLNLSHLSRGIYYLRIINVRRTIITRILLV